MYGRPAWPRLQGGTAYEDTDGYLGGRGREADEVLPGKASALRLRRPILEWVVEAARAVDPRPVVVVGHGREQVMARIHGVDFAVQEEQKGTGHAVMMAREFIQDADIVVVMAGDAPLDSRGNDRRDGRGILRPG